VYSQKCVITNCFLALILLSACSSKKPDTTIDGASGKGIAVPEKITKLDVAPDTITAYVTVDNNPTRYAMVLDSNANTMVAADIPVSFGNHIFHMTFEYQYSGYESPLILATADINATISQTGQSISAQENNYNYDFDEDNDGFTNIRELNDSNGPTDPTNPDSIPLVDENQSPVTTASMLASEGPFSSPVTVSLSCSDMPADNHSGCAVIHYAINDVANSFTPTVANPSIDLEFNSTTKLTYYSEDNAGNVEAEKPADSNLQIYVIDQLAPLITAEPPAGDYTSAQTVRLYCQDGVDGSGCGDITYTLVDGSGNTITQIYNPDHSNPINITSSSTLSVSAVDLADNSVAQTVNYNINIPPGISNPTLAFANRNGDDFTLTWTPAADQTTQQSQLQYQLYHSDTNNLGSVANVRANGTTYGALTTRNIINGLITETVTGVSNSLDSYWTVLVQNDQGYQSVYDATLPTDLGFLGLLDKDFDFDGIIVKDAIGGGIGWDTTKAITLDAQGRIVAVGESFDADNAVIMTLMRFLPQSGQLDTSFNSPQGFVTFPSPSRGQAVTIDSQDRIIVAGTIDNKMTVWRYSDTGVLDTTGFNSPMGYITDAPVGNWSYGNAVGMVAADEIMVAGYVYDFSTNYMTLWRIDASGALVFATNDTSANTQAAYGMAIANSANGYNVALTGNSGATAAIWMYDASGNTVSTFGTNGLVTFPPVNPSDTSVAYSVAFDPTQNKLIAAGSTTDTDTKMSLWTFDISNNTLDSSFNSTGYVSFSDLNTTRGQALVLDTSITPYKILVTGRVGATSLDMITWRYQANGLPDTSFNGSQYYIVHNSAGGGNRNDWGNDIAIDSDGKILIGGQSESLNNNDMAIWRYR
jgi:uncharacterized delta-60 repeat protein